MNILNTMLPAAILIGVAAGASEVPAPPSVAERHSPTSGSPSLGPGDAPDTLTLFIDYQCPVCRRAEREMERLVQDLGGSLRVEIRHNPLAIHRNAFDAAVATKAAQRQGKFWEYHALLLESPAHDRETLVALGERVGCVAATLRHDIEDPALRREIETDIAAAAAAGARGTPGFVINGHAVSGWASYEWIRGIVAKHRSVPPQSAPD